METADAIKGLSSKLQCIDESGLNAFLDVYMICEKALELFLINKGYKVIRCTVYKSGQMPQKVMSFCAGPDSPLPSDISHEINIIRSLRNSLVHSSRIEECKARGVVYSANIVIDFVKAVLGE